jgi:hypothetical protein
MPPGGGPMPARPPFEAREQRLRIAAEPPKPGPVMPLRATCADWVIAGDAWKHSLCWFG